MNGQVGLYEKVELGELDKCCVTVGGIGKTFCGNEWEWSRGSGIRGVLVKLQVGGRGDGHRWTGANFNKSKNKLLYFWTLLFRAQF